MVEGVAGGVVGDEVEDKLTEAFRLLAQTDYYFCTSIAFSPVVLTLLTCNVLISYVYGVLACHWSL